MACMVGRHFSERLGSEDPLGLTLGRHTERRSDKWNGVESSFGGEDSGRLEELRGRREIKDRSLREAGSCQVL